MITDEQIRAIVKDVVENVTTSEMVMFLAVSKRIIELHEAIKPIPEPVGYGLVIKGVLHATKDEAGSVGFVPLYTTLPTREPLSHEQSKPKPEPVAYRWWNQGCNCDECDQYFYSEDPDFISKNREPLYPAPPTREPLSKDKINDIARNLEDGYTLFDFTRLVEQAHGIGVK